MMKRVLLVDNVPAFLMTRGERLEDAGYFVLTADSLEKARAILRTRHVHLVTVDVRMLDEESIHDLSGLALVHDPEFADILKLVVTGYERDPDVVNDALEPPSDPRSLPRAVRFLDKKKGWQEMVDRIGWALDTYAHINWSLTLDWPNPAYEDGLASWLEPDLPRGEWRERGEELADLLRMAFYDFDRLRVDRRLWHAGPRVALAATAWQQDAIVDRVIIIHRRPPAFAPATPPAASPASLNALEGVAQPATPPRPPRTLHYAAELFELPGVRLDKAPTLRQFYADSRPAALGECFTKLLQTGLAPWEEPQLADAAADADALLRAHAHLPADAPEALGRALAAAGEAAARAGLATLSQTDGRLRLRPPRGRELELPYPADWLTRPGPAAFSQPLALGESYGAPPVDAVLVAADGRPWLTDFSRAGRAPLLSVLAGLETQVLHDLHPFANVTQFADAAAQLLRPDDLTPRLDAPMAETRRLFAAVQAIRQQAAAFGDAAAYFHALFYHTARRLLDAPPDGADRRAALPPLCLAVSLGLLARRLDTFQDAPGRPTHPGLWLDPASRRWWLDDAPLPRLAETPYRFLLHLWERPGQHCRNADIMAAIDCAQMDGNYPAVLVGQIRKGLGLSVAGRYLVSSGGGYTLYPDGRPDRPLPAAAP